MSHPIKMLLAAFMAVLMLAWPARAQDTPDPDMVLATVNGTEITLGHVIALRAGLPPQYDQFPPNLLFRGILDQLIQHELLRQSLEDGPSRKSRVSIENETRAILAGEVMSGIVSKTPSEEELQALYDAKYPAELEELEYLASHILVENEESAKTLIEQLAGGADFATLAREHSIGPSAAVGGDLGWFGPGDMVEAFFEAVVALSPGEVSPPVQTQFGWHLIRLAETRSRQRPELDAVRPEIEEEWRNAALEDFLKVLEGKASIERADTDAIDPAVITDIDLLEN